MRERTKMTHTHINVYTHKERENKIKRKMIVRKQYRQEERKGEM